MEDRIQALKTLYESGIRTYAFIGPILPMNPEKLSEKVNPHVHAVLIDRMNYVSKTRKIYERMKSDEWLDSSFIDEIVSRLTKGFAGKEIRLC
jgi:DNA repair photolyase